MEWAIKLNSQLGIYRHVRCFYCLLLFDISFEGANDSKTVWSFSLSPGLVFVLSQFLSFLCMRNAIQNVLWCKR